MKRKESARQKEARLSAFERDLRPHRKPSDNEWQLNHVDSIDWIMDTSGVYVLINWDVKTDTVRLDIMSDNHEALQSFQGECDNVRKHTLRWMSDNVKSNNGIVSVSLTHAAYIGSELQLADIMRIDYIQDGTFKRSDNVSESVTSDKVCSKCGYSKCGYSSDNILMCLDCGEAWPTSDNSNVR